MHHFASTNFILTPCFEVQGREMSNLTGFSVFLANMAPTVAKLAPKRSAKASLVASKVVSLVPEGFKIDPFPYGLATDSERN